MLTRDGERLASWTTLRVGGPANRFVEVESRTELFDVVARADAAGERLLVLGGGSNLVVSDSGFDGVVVRVATRGTEVGAESGTQAVVTAEAGENWDRFVVRAVASGWVGVEALSGIPGTVGAVPIQNVGAYGQEVADTIVSVHAFDRVERRTRTLLVSDCGFSYRDSVLKQQPERYVVGAVTFRFERGTLGAPVRYAEVSRALGVEVGQRVASDAVRAAVLNLRRGKGMVLDDTDHDTWSAGSFFTNPFVAGDELPLGAPAFAQPDGRVKTSAAWLIEHAGFARGYGTGAATLSTKHPLAITNRGDATAEDVLMLARQIRAGVEQQFKITLQLEPVCISR